MLSTITPTFFPRSALDMDMFNDRPLSMLPSLASRPFGSSSFMSPLVTRNDPFRSMRDPFFDMGPSALDVFDPFNAMDRYKN